MIKAAFFDLDGTLFDTSGHSTQITRDAIAALRSRGIRTFIATGRSPYEIRVNHMLEGMHFDGIVSLNGQYCYTGDRILHRQLFDKRDLATILKLQADIRLPCAFMEQDSMYMNYIDDRVLAAQKDFHTPPAPVRDVSSALERDILMVSVYLTREQANTLLMPHLKYSDIYRWNPSALDVMPRGVNKQTGIEKILSACGLRWEQVIAFGDGENDLEMLEHAGIGVAMGNSVPELLHSGLYVTDHVDRNGVASALHHFGLI